MIMSQVFNPLRTQAQASLYCRRDSLRKRLSHCKITCWSEGRRQKETAAVEVDSRGARLLVPFKAKVGETVSVSFTDRLGLSQTRRARVAWVLDIEVSSKVMAGLAFDRPLSA